ncbi:hypothetical protein LTS08_001122 [Lithohypha guttulata]|nr:hypothetical protein LTS08_001122 [Lithohypha guttulata]
MNDDTTFYDFAEFLQSSPTRGSASSASETTGLSFWDPAFTGTPATSPPNSERLMSSRSAIDITTTVDLTSPVTLSFNKGAKLFKLRYTKIDVCRDNAGTLRCIELSDPVSLSGVFIHTFVSTKRPIPHLEQPATLAQKSLRVSFLDEQTVQVAQTLFNTQPRYTFERTSDCDRFQEAVLGFAVIFAAGVAEISSKGRGEEAISQNIRVCRQKNGSLNLLFFANSQRKEKKRYLSVPVDAIDSLEVPKKMSKPVIFRLATSNDITAQMKTLSIVLLDGNDVKRLCTLLQASGVKVSGHR